MLFGVAALLAPACAGGGSGGAESGRPLVLAAFYPLAFLAEQVAGGEATVVDLTPVGVEPHDLELTPRQVGTITEADLVVYVGGGFQPALEDALAASDARTIDALEVGPVPRTNDDDQPPGEAADPHVWLDPVRMSALAGRVASELGEIDSGDAGAYRGEAAELAERLEELDRDFRRGLARCRRREIVTSHAAFGYLAARYRLEQVGIAGLDPESEPSPRRVAEVAEFARRHGVTTIFFETQVPRDLAETLAEELRVTTAVLDPIESEPARGDYFSAMEDNLTALREALACR